MVILKNNNDRVNTFSYVCNTKKQIYKSHKIICTGEIIPKKRESFEIYIFVSSNKSHT